MNYRSNRIDDQPNRFRFKLTHDNCVCVIISKNIPTGRYSFTTEGSFAEYTRKL